MSYQARLRGGIRAMPKSTVPMFSKRHYNALAAVVANGALKPSERRFMAVALAAAFVIDSNKCNVQKFYKACGILEKT